MQKTRRLVGTGADRHEVLLLCCGEQSRFSYEAHPEWYLEGEARAPARRDINCQVCVLPMLELALRYVEATTMDLSNQNVAGTNPEFTVLEAHGR